jgi:uncharacterized phage protein (predicted DNA packaging)
MTALTLEDAKAHLRVTFDSDDLYIESLIEAAESYVEDVGVPLGTSITPAIEHAVKLLVSHWYGNRDAAGDKPSQDIAFGVNSLLQPYRTQTL